MKNQSFFVFALLCLLSSATACNKILDCEDGDGAIVTEELSLDDFNSISLSTSIDIVLQQGESQKVEVTGYANLIDEIETDVKGKEWCIKMEDRCYEDLEDMLITITLPDIENVSITGSGDIEFTGGIAVDKLDLEITGSGDIDCDCTLDSDDLSIEITGSGDVSLNGVTKNQDIEITGSGEVTNFDLISDECDVKISGSGSSEVFVNDHLEVKITGSGTVYYKGSPTISSEITGSGKLKFVE